MSYVTNIILNLGTLEEHEERMREVNAFFEKEGKRGLVLMDEGDAPRYWQGGSKAMECWIAMGGFNYLALNDFQEHLKSLKWSFPEDMQLIYKEQDDDTWSIWQLDLSNK